MQGDGGSISFILSDTVIDELGYRSPVRNNKTIETPFVAQDVGKQVVVCGGWSTIQVEKCSHDRANTGMNGALVGR